MPVCKPTFARTAVACAFLWSIPGSVSAAESTIESIQRAAVRVTELRAETARLQTEWNLQRDLVQSTIAALAKRAEVLEAERDLLLASTATSRADIERIRARYVEAADQFEAVEAILDRLTARLIALRPWLPPRLSDGLELAYLSLQDPTMSPGERMQFATAICNRASQFNKTITYGEEALEIEGLEDARLVEVLYWGLSHAYAFDRAANRGFLGTPGEQGWVWHERPGLGGRVASLISVYRDESQPAFFEVPALIANPFAAVSSP